MSVCHNCIHKNVCKHTATVQEFESQHTNVWDTMLNHSNIFSVECKERIEKSTINFRWISISEQQPKKEGKYLCKFKYKEDNDEVISENYYCGNGLWLSDKSCITAWMPIPDEEG